MKIQTTQTGFTLIEVLIYLALFSVIAGAVAETAYLLAQSSGQLQTKTLLLEEGNFLLEKLAWAFAGGSSIAANQSPLSLSVIRYNDLNNPLVFDVSGSQLRLRQGTGQPENLNASAVTISNLVFAGLPTNTAQLAGASISFTLQAKTSGGQTISQDFQSSQYLW